MAYERIVISSGHGKYVRGASGILDEVDEARRVVDCVAGALRARSVSVKTFHDNTSHDQNTNLNTIVNYHNAQARDLDVSVHFNAYEQVSKPMGVEVLYVTQSALASQMSTAIARCGFINRGAKKRTDLFFLNNTEMPAILLEVCFVDSEADADIYNEHFLDVCDAIADILGGEGDIAGETPPPELSEALFEATGKCSNFGGPDDEGVAEDEGLAFITSIDQAEHLFLPTQPSGTSGLARRLNPYIHYLACRWDYSVTSKDMLKGGEVALVRAQKTGIALTAFPADWGPNQYTGRVADLSPGLMTDLGIETDDVVEITFPFDE
jgi:N-acetylmuramoyl-L-alanine amidase